MNFGKRQSLAVAVLVMSLSGSSVAHAQWSYVHNNGTGAAPQGSTLRDNTRVVTTTPGKPGPTETEKNKKKIKKAIVGAAIIQTIQKQQGQR